MNADTGPQGPTAVRSPFGWIPLPIRMAVYAVGFLAVMLGALPWLFYRIDVRVPVVHVDIGQLRIVGVVLFVVGLVLYTGASGVLVRRGKGAFVEFDPPTKLVVEGPYRYVRNPVAGFLLATALGEVIALSSTGALLLFCIYVVVAHLQVTRLEEPLLRKRFGRAYDEYCAHVPRWIPRRSRWEAPE